MAENNKRPLWPWLILAAAGLLLAAFVDLPLDVAVYNPHNPIAIFMEVYGWCPVVLAPLAFCALWARDARTGPARAGAFAGMAALLALLAYVCFGYLKKRGWLALGRPHNVALVVVALFVCLWIAAFWRAPAEKRAALKLYAFGGSALAAAQLMAVNVVKLLWNRARFDEMLAGRGLTQFTPWFRPFGAGGSSFPSGHTANAACILALVLLCDVLPAWQKRRGLVYTLCWGYTVFMGATRVIIGRHFLSDTIAGAAIVALLLFALRRTGWYKRAMARLGTTSTKSAQPEKPAVAGKEIP